MDNRKGTIQPEERNRRIEKAHRQNGPLNQTNLAYEYTTVVEKNLSISKLRATIRSKVKNLRGSARRSALAHEWVYHLSNFLDKR